MYVQELKQYQGSEREEEKAKRFQTNTEDITAKAIIHRFYVYANARER
jgi:hypothetical protein